MQMESDRVLRSPKAVSGSTGYMLIGTPYYGGCLTGHEHNRLDTNWSYSALRRSGIPRRGNGRPEAGL